MTYVETMKMDLILIFSYNYYLKLMESRQIFGIRYFHFITITMGILDQ